MRNSGCGLFVTGWLSAIATATVWLPNTAPAWAQSLAHASPQFLAQATGSIICPAQLGAAISAIVERPQFARSRWGIVVQPLSVKGTSPPLYTRDARYYFVPASNAKLLSTAAILYRLKSQYRIRTSVYRVADPTGQIVLRVVGRGDPSLTNAALKLLAQQLSQQGIRRIDRLLGDDSYFNGAEVNPNWEWGDLQGGYGATVNGLMVNQNAIDLQIVPQGLGQPLQVRWENPSEAAGWQIINTARTVAATEPEFLDVGRDLSKPILRVQGQLRVGSAAEPVAVSISDPAQNFLQQFRTALAAEKITVAQAEVTTRPASQSEPEIAFVQSPPLATLLAETNQESNNLYAEALLRTLGKVSVNASNSSPLELGLSNVKATLAGLGVDGSGFILVDASGLARQDRVSPDAIVQTLQVMSKVPESSIYRASLAVAGKSGTLRDRFIGTPVQGILQGKTGTIQGAVSLSGYLTPANYSPLVFSILVNQSDASFSTLRGAIDDIVLVLARLKPC
jgi:D-alanyl-D-alanine carboxypeptidase/D-alanyl-D-alanine-endopeptidase (penicillin-binding protein 4)